MEKVLKVFQQTGWQFFGKIITSLSTIIILGMVARVYGTVGTGILTLTLAYLSFFILAADFGLNAHILPELFKKDFSLTWQKLLGLRIIWSAILSLLAILIVFAWPVTAHIEQTSLFRQSVILGAVMVVAAGVFITTTAFFQSRLRYDLNVFAIILGTLATLGLAVILVRLNTSPSNLILGYVLGGFVSGIFALAFVKKFIQNILPIIDFAFIKKVFLQSWPLSLTLLLNTVYFRLDVFILTSMKSFSEVGVYNIAYQIFQGVLVIPGFIMNSFYPIMLKDYSYNLQRFTANLTKAVFGMFALALAGTFIILVFSSPLINVITGSNDFAGSAASLQILALSFPAFFITAVLMWVMIVLRKYKTMLSIYFIGLIFSVILNIVFIPRYSYFGAAWVTVISEYLILILQIVILRKALWTR